MASVVLCHKGSAAHNKFSRKVSELQLIESRYLFFSFFFFFFWFQCSIILHLAAQNKSRFVSSFNDCINACIKFFYKKSISFYIFYWEGGGVA